MYTISTVPPQSDQLSSWAGRCQKACLRSRSCCPSATKVLVCLGHTVSPKGLANARPPMTSQLLPCSCSTAAQEGKRAPSVRFNSHVYTQGKATSSLFVFVCSILMRLLRRNSMAALEVHTPVDGIIADSLQLSLPHGPGDNAANVIAERSGAVLGESGSSLSGP